MDEDEKSIKNGDSSSNEISREGREGSIIIVDDDEGLPLTGHVC